METRLDLEYNNKISQLDLATMKYNKFVENITNLYNDRIAFLKEYLGNTVKSIKDDSILMSMKDDPTLAEFFSNRLGEIFTDSILSEQEIQLHNLMQEISLNKISKQEDENKIRNLSLKIMELERDGNDVIQRWEGIQGELNSKEYEIDEIYKENLRLNELNKSLKITLDENVKEYMNNITSKDECIRILNQSMGDLKKNYQAIYGELEISKLDKGTLDSELSRHIQGIQSLKYENEELKEKLKETEQQMIAAQEELAQIKIQVEELNEIIDSDKKSLNELKYQLQLEIKEKHKIEIQYKEDINRYKELLTTEKERNIILDKEFHKEDAINKENYSKMKSNLDNLQTMYDAIKEIQNQKDKEIESLKNNLMKITTEKDNYIKELTENYDKIINSLKETHRRESVWFS